MANHTLELNVKRMSQLLARMEEQKKAAIQNMLKQTVRSQLFNERMVQFSLTPRPSSKKNLNDEINSNYHHLRISKAIQTANQMKHNLALASHSPKPGVHSQNAALSFMNQYKTVIAPREAVLKKKLAQEQLALQHAREAAAVQLTPRM